MSSLLTLTRVARRVDQLWKMVQEIQGGGGAPLVESGSGWIVLQGSSPGGKVRVRTSGIDSYSGKPEGLLGSELDVGGCILLVDDSPEDIDKLLGVDRGAVAESEL